MRNHWYTRAAQKSKSPSPTNWCPNDTVSEGSLLEAPPRQTIFKTCNSIAVLIGASLLPSKNHSFCKENATPTETILEALPLETGRAHPQNKDPIGFSISNMQKYRKRRMRFPDVSFWGLLLMTLGSTRNCRRVEESSDYRGQNTAILTAFFRTLFL